MTGDITSVNGKHVENFVITTDDIKITMIPWVQAGKGSELFSQNTVKILDLCQRAYNDWYANCEDKEGSIAGVRLARAIFPHTAYPGVSIVDLRVQMTTKKNP